MTAANFTILPPLEFISDVTREAKHAKKRIFLQAMDIEPGNITNHLLDVLMEGKKRLLDTRLSIDHYSLLTQDGVFNYLPLFSAKKELRRKNRIKKSLEYFNNLKNTGVNISYISNPSMLERVFPLMGRNHIKIAVVDDIVWIGGINFNDGNLQSIDSMVKLTDKDLVEPIVNLFHESEKSKKFQDKKITISEKTSLFIDGGNIGKSIILDEAVRLIKGAEKSVRIITPIIPDTRLARAVIHAKKRGLMVEIFVPHHVTMRGVYKPLDLFNSLILTLQRNPVPIHYKRRLIHAKMLLVDDIHFLMGSHNLTTRGVTLGTQELSISSSETHFINQALSFFDHVRSL